MTVRVSVPIALAIAVPVALTVAISAIPQDLTLAVAIAVAIAVLCADGRRHYERQPDQAKRGGQCRARKSDGSQHPALLRHNPVSSDDGDMNCQRRKCPNGCDLVKNEVTPSSLPQEPPSLPSSPASLIHRPLALCRRAVRFAQP